MTVIQLSIRLIVTLSLAVLVHAQSTVKYVATPITIPAGYRFYTQPYPSSQVSGLYLNNANQIAGTAQDDVGRLRAFLISGGVTRILGILPNAPVDCLGTSENFSVANGLNDHGMVVGSAGAECFRLGRNKHAFLFAGGALIDLGSLVGKSGNSSASGIDNNGNIVGTSNTSPDDTCVSGGAFLYLTRMSNLGAFAGPVCLSSSATSVSPGGVIAGHGQVALKIQDLPVAYAYVPHPAIFESGTLTDIGVLDQYHGAVPHSVNDKRQLAGIMWSGTVGHAFFHDGHYNDIGTLPGTSESLAHSINSNSEVVGVSLNYGDPSSYLGFHYKAGVLTDLNSVVSRTQIANGTILAAYSVNDSGKILVETTKGIYVLSPIVTFPSLVATLTHTGDFSAGQRNAVYTAFVVNAPGAGATIGQINLVPTLPTGLSLVSLSGSGWTCNSTFCSRTDVLAGGGAYAPVTITVNVAANAPSALVPSITAAGGNSASAFASDPTNISPLLLSHSRLRFTAIQGGASLTPTQEIAVSFASGAALAWTSSKNQPWITLASAAAPGAARFQVSAVPGALTPGLYTGIVSVVAPASSAIAQTITVELNVIAPSAASAPFGAFDTPANNATGIAGNIAVTGWALDDIGVKSVTLWRDPVGPEPTHPNGYVYIADALFIPGARPDVETAYPNSPFAYRAGWGYLMLTNGLPSLTGPKGNGVYRIHAIATDVEGNQVKLGTKTITVDNLHSTKPFGTLDTPAPGQTISGTYLNWGWAMTPQPGFIAVDGLKVWVGVDGVNFAHPVYGINRADIAASFPGYANSATGVGYYLLDTTRFTNGLHNLGWLVYDNLGRGDGIGSRFVDIQNAPAAGGDPAPASQADSRFHLRTARLQRPATPAGGYPAFRQGYDLNAALVPLRQAGEGLLEPIQLKELDRLELHLPAGQQWTAALRVGAELRDLPIGSTFDAEGGIFYWQLGPAFLGDYMLEFRADDGTVLPVVVRVGG